MGLKAIWDLIKALKGGSYDKLVGLLLPAIFENKVVGPFLARNKTTVGYVLTVIGFGLSEALVWFPDLTWLGPVDAYYITLSGLVLTGLGISHRGVKERRDE